MSKNVGQGRERIATEANLAFLAELCFQGKRYHVEFRKGTPMRERLGHIKGKLRSRHVSVYYAWYNPKAVYMYDTEDALEDFLWMIAEIERLRVENNDLQSPRYSELKRRLLQKSLSENAKAIKNLKKQRLQEGKE